MIIVDLLYNLSVLIALSVLSGFINLRYDREKNSNKIIQGLLFGATVIVGILNPFVLTPGIIFDGRSIIISICSLIFGPISGVIASVIAVSFRLYIGGSGVTMGILVILSSFIIGLVFHHRNKKISETRMSYVQLYLFGLIVHFTMLLCVFALPSQNIFDTYKSITFSVIVIFPLVTILIGKILLDQEENERVLSKLKTSEESYRLLVENNSDLIVKIDKNGIFKFVSQSYCRLFGKNKEELIGNSFIPLVHKDDVEKTQIAMLDLYHPPHTCYAEQRALTIEGWRWLAWSDTAVLDDQANVESIVGVGRDITEIKSAQEDLLKSEEKFYKAFQVSPDSLTLTKISSGKIIDANNGFERVFGYSPKEIIGKSTIELNIWANPEDRTKFISMLNKEGSVKDFEAVGKKKNNELLNGLISAEIIEVGNESLILTVVRDITATKMAEESLRKNEEKYRMLVELASDAFFQGDTNGNLITINDKSIELTGYSKAELLKMNINDLFASDVLKNTPLRYDLLKAGETIKSERSLLTKDGGILIIEMNSRQMPDGTYQSFFRDITERKKLFTELIKAKEKAEEMNRIKTFFFANMSHELRTPFVGIQGYSELLSTTLKEPEEKEMADQILKASKRLTETLNKILNVTRLEFDKLELKITNVDVIELIKSLAILYSKSAEINNTRIKINTPSSPIIIKSDLKLLNEILTNLLNNAVKYTRNGTITISCDTKEFENKNILSIIVADTGVGIPKEKQDVIWQEFRQASEGFNRSFEGTGLGLTIIKKYITALNGTITLDSDIGKGTKFTINLPVIVSDKEPQAYGKIIESENDDSDIPTDNTKTSILYVEDDTIALKYIDKVLSPFYKITTAFSADVAIELVAKFKYDILMLDINLGRGIDGVELMRNIRKKTEYKNTPIVAVTAYAADSDREEFLSKGFSHYISKPFSSTQLKNLLKGIIK